jgi:5-methylcytosine-specific restriction endonuclease McrA
VTRRPYDSPEYKANRALVRRTATRCAICARPLRSGQAIDVHHIDTIDARRARGLEPDHSLQNLRATHSSCNRGGKPPPTRRPTTRADIHTGEGRGEGVDF